MIQSSFFKNNFFFKFKCNHSSISIRLDNGRQRTPSQLVPGKGGGIIEERTRAQSRAGNALNAEDQYQVSIGSYCVPYGIRTMDLTVFEIAEPWLSVFNNKKDTLSKE